MIYPKLTIAIDQYITEVLYYKSDWYERGQKSQLKHWKSTLGHLRLNQISPETIKENLPDRSNATKNRYLTALSCVFNHFGNGIHPVSKVKKYKEGRGRVRFLSDQERIALLQACKQSTHPHLYALVVVALSTGMRKNEILKLTKDRVDLSRGLIHLVDTKNKEPRTIPIGGHALELVTQLIDKNPSWCKYVFPTRTFSYYKHTPDAWHKALDEAGISNFRWHDLRHSCASSLAMNGVDLLTIGTLLGHKSYEMTMRYAHLSVGHLRGVLGNLNDMMFPDSP